MSVNTVPGLGIADRDDEPGRGEEGASDRAPARIVDQLEQEEIRQEEDEQAGVAVGDQDDAASRPNGARQTSRSAARTK